MLSTHAYAKHKILVDIISVIAHGKTSCFDTWCVNFKTSDEENQQLYVRGVLLSLYWIDVHGFIFIANL